MRRVGRGGGGGLGWKRHGYGVDLILTELKLIQKEDVVTELQVTRGLEEENL